MFDVPLASTFVPDDVDVTVEGVDSPVRGGDGFVVFHAGGEVDGLFFC